MVGFLHSSIRTHCLEGGECKWDWGIDAGVGTYCESNFGSRKVKSGSR
jgi:hypothetical protein